MRIAACSMSIVIVSASCATAASAPGRSVDPRPVPAQHSMNRRLSIARCPLPMRAMSRTLPQPVEYGAMIQTLPCAPVVVTVVVVTVAVSGSSRTLISGQPVRAIPRPPVMKITPEDGSVAPDGYAPIPEWLGQTRAPRPAKTAEYRIETVAEGLSGAFCFSFLPDGRILVGERGGRVRIVGKEGRASEVGGLPADMFVRGGQGLFEVRADRA